MQRIGSRAQVMHGNAKMTGGGLRKKDLKYNKQGKIVSKKMSQRAKKEKRLQKAGYTTVKGQFGTIRDMKGGDQLNKDVYFFLYHLSLDLSQILQSPNQNINFNKIVNDFFEFNNIKESNNLRSIVTTIINILKEKKEEIYEYLKNYKNNLNKSKVPISLPTIRENLIYILTDNNITSKNKLVEYLQKKSTEQVQEESTEQVQEEEEESTEQVLEEEEESTEQENINEKIKEILKTSLNLSQNEINKLNSLKLNNSKINTILKEHKIKRPNTSWNFIGNKRTKKNSIP